MVLIERDGFLSLLQNRFQQVATGEGHCIFLSGEAGIGKTTLVNAFCREQKEGTNIYQGACDALFTPRPLAPLHDIVWQVNKDLWPADPTHGIEYRWELFSRLFHELSEMKDKILIVFEDIHWADEATLDFIKFFARRIAQLRCLFILTFRDDEIHTQHPLRNVLGQLPPASFTRMELTPLSRQSVENMAATRGYSGEDVYSISGGNPFYVTEILSSYSVGVPDNIRDSILSSYNRQEEKAKQIWELLSVIPTGFEIKYLEKFDPQYAVAIDRCLESRILIVDRGMIHFKHELFRRTIETALSHLKRVSLNRKILELFRDSFENKQEIERIIHHAKNANDSETVVHYAPLAASQAACLGSHVEAARLYLTAIEFYPGEDAETLIKLYGAYAYECYLTSQIKEAIVYTEKLLNLRIEKKDINETGNGYRFLSRLWWLLGNRKNAEKFGDKAIEVLDTQPPSHAKAMAYSNMSQLKMLCDQPDACISWGEKAIAMAEKINDSETLSHALNNVGSEIMSKRESESEGTILLQKSLDIALKNSFHEHAARAYSNLGSNGVKLKNYPLAKKMLEEGILYCEARDLDAWRSNMLSLKACLLMETGDWDSALRIAEQLLQHEYQSTTFAIGSLTVVGTIKMRRGEKGALALLQEAAKKGFETLELQRIIPSLIALMEYEWLTGETVVKTEDLNRTAKRMDYSINFIEQNEFAFWLLKVRKQRLPLPVMYEGYKLDNPKVVQEAFEVWEAMGNPYLQALALFEGSDSDKREAITRVHELGANAVYEKMKQEMRSSGIKNIPRGIRKATRENPAFLTDRELDVLRLLKEGMQNKEIAAKLYISAKTVDHHISSILFKLDVNSRTKAVSEAVRQEILK